MFKAIKQRILDNDQSHKLSGTHIDNFPACFIDKITNTYPFEDFSALAEYEKNQTLKILTEQCEKELSLK